MTAPASPQPSLRSLPSVDRALRDIGPTDLPRPVVIAIVRRELAAERERLAHGDVGGAWSEAAHGEVMARVRRAIDDVRRSRLRPVINATGIIVHTNLGRSPLGPDVVRAVTDAAAHYTNLEYDLTAGERGGRAAYLERSLALLCAAEAATIVNNCAAALVLVLRHFVTSDAGRDEVVISRGELVQIGGGFRIPEILQASGAALREVGTTNKTTLADYRGAIGPRTAMVLRVHQSNFYIGGFVESPPAADIAALARERSVPLVVDLGSGATFDTATLGGGEREPTPAEAVAGNADLVTFSGDKLLGGPQAGVVAGGGAHVAAIKREPFFRALRCDKLILAAMEATVDLHLAGREQDVPIRAMMSVGCDELRARAEALVRRLADLPLAASVGEAAAQVGGGSLPRTTISSVTVDLRPTAMPLDELSRRLRRGTPPVIGHIADGRLRLDLRTVFARQDGDLAAAVRAAAAAALVALPPPAQP